MTPTPPSTGHTLQDTIDALTTDDLLLLIAELAAEVSSRRKREMRAHMDMLEREERRADAERIVMRAYMDKLERAEQRAQAERDEVAAKWEGLAGTGSLVGPVARPVSDTNGSDPRAVDTQLGATLDGGDG